jgi:hypothetical protein
MYSYSQQYTTYKKTNSNLAYNAIYGVLEGLLR